MVSKRQRSLVITTLVVGVLVLSVAGFALIADRQTVRTVDDAVSAFRAGQATGDPAVGTDGPIGERTDASAPGEPGAPATTAPPPGTAGAAAGSGGGAPAGDTSTAPAETAQRPAPEGQDQPGDQPEAEPAAEQRQEPPTLRRPDEGVYVYATDGGESVAFGRAGHEYPDETTITVRHSDCGYTTRWEALEERWDEFDICGSPERSWMRKITVYHEFYERGMTHVYACGERSTISAAGSRAGERWTWECRTDGGAMRTTVDVIEFATREVGGEEVEAVHVRIHNVMSGDTEGERRADVWFARWTGLELHGEYHVDSMANSPMGRTRYVEDLTRTLTSLHPRR